MDRKHTEEFAALVGMVVTFTLAIAVIFGLLQYAALRSRQEIHQSLERIKFDIKDVEKTQDEAFELLEEIKEQQVIDLANTLSFVGEPQAEEEVIESTEVIFTNYYVGDGSSGNKTASGLTTNDFDVNEEGFYTYEDKVVLATANTSRWDRELFQGYDSHELYEELEIELNGQTYEAITLDLCGSCQGTQGETTQRYDIFTTGNVIGKSLGSVYKDGGK